jgi:hypothetical protein
MKDYLGQTLKAGDFIIYPGSGNRQAEYGLILYKILEVKKDALSVERLDANYSSKSIVRKKSTLKSSTKIVKAVPPQSMVDLFNNPDSNFRVVANWIHGRTIIDWDILKVVK